MSFSQLSYINSKLRARLSNRLSEEQFKNLLHAPTVEEAVLQLRETYYSVFYESYEKTGDLRLAEIAMAQKEIELFSGLRAGLSGAERNLMTSLLMLFEIKNIKTLLGTWFSRTILKRDTVDGDLFLHNTILYEIPFDQILSASDFDSLAAAFEATPYKEPIQEALEAVRTDRSLFRMDLAMDLFGYKKLKTSINALSGDSRYIAAQFFGTEVDFENLICQIRYKTMLKNAGEALKLMITGGIHLSQQNISDIISSQATTEAFLKEHYASSFPPVPGKTIVQTVEKTRDLELGKRAHALMAKQPFSVAMAIAYFYLMKTESNRIISILQGRYYGLSEEKIKESLCL